MFEITENKDIHITRGDVAVIDVSAKKKKDGSAHTFKKGDIVRLLVVEKGDYNSPVLKKEVEIEEDTEIVSIELHKEDTKIGELIKKPKDYWFEIEINPDTMPQTIIGHTKDGAKIFKLLPEGGGD